MTGGSGPTRLRPLLAGILQDMGLRRADGAPRPRALVLVGPAGVGKTTTAIKLAADLRRGSTARRPS